MKFHHNNTRPHMHKSFLEYLKEEKFVIMSHPPYSPDLAPRDFWLFDYIKARLVTCSYAQSLSNAIIRIVGDIDKKSGIRNLISR